MQRALNAPSMAEQFVLRWPMVDGIEGWLPREDAALLDCMLTLQKNIGVPSSGLLELGVWKGRCAAVLAGHLSPEEILLLVDAWLQREPIETALAAVLGTQLSLQQIQLFAGTTADLGRQMPVERRFRCIHVDAEHTSSGLRADLQLARRMMEPSGMVVVDDVFNGMYPHLSRTLFEFLADEGRDLVCVLLGFNKAYLCGTRFLDIYTDAMLAVLRTDMAARGQPVTLCRTTDRVEWPGLSVVHDLGVALRGPDFNQAYVRA